MNKYLRPEYVAVLASLLILSVILLFKPLIGMANNGDFERIMTSASLSYATDDREEKYFNYFISRFPITGEIWTAIPTYLSSQVILVKLATWISQLFTPGWLDIRFLALLYMLLLSAAFYCIIRSVPAQYRAVRWTLAIMLIVVFADAGYAAYFNSLFGEPVSLVFLLLLMGFAMAISRQVHQRSVQELQREEQHSGSQFEEGQRSDEGGQVRNSRKSTRTEQRTERAKAKRSERTQWWLLAGFYLAGIFVVGAKVQNAPVVLILLLIGIRLWGLSPAKLWKAAVVTGSALLVLTSVAAYTAINKDIKVINQFQTVFYGILKTSETPEEDLRELGLNPDWAVLAGYNYFVPDMPLDIKDPEFEAELREHISHSKVALFYLKHPQRFWNILSIAAEHAFTIKPTYMGNYEKEEGQSPGALSHAFTLYSKAKLHLLPKSMALIIVSYLVFGLIWISEYVKKRSRARRLALEMIMGVAIIGLIQLVVPVIGDGLADLEKHLFMFNVTWDMMTVAVAAWIVHTLVERRKRINKLLNSA
ncbi:glycan biosynthesis hexose transferase WsfD [Paenibacillus senegalensis]|uniref:glycan biosynthesis hexose transferase WsfD n=1 Tax=Paenibacillus senegalensis TaxID=1465766 RepID=UPI000288C687|nr:hypothetical protein [Paenibacillus senegalensis]